MPINEEKRFFSWLQVLDNPISVTEFFILLNLSYICWKAKVISEGLNFFSSHGSRGLRRNFVWGIMWNGNFLYVCMRDTRVAINRTHNFVKYLAPTYNSTGWSSKNFYKRPHHIKVKTKYIFCGFPRLIHKVTLCIYKVTLFPLFSGDYEGMGFFSFEDGV